jgi:predicted enzyme related to lactoylglutathione lyase
MNIENHKPGSFCWLELGTTDQNAAKKFYGALFGWTPEDTPMGPGETYTTFQLNGRKAAAGYTLMKDMVEKGIPPHWMLYIAVKDADAAVKRVAELGGKVMAEPFDVFEFGRMAVIQDPTGGTISVWQPKNHKGTEVAQEPGTLCWADLNTPQPEIAAKFYADWLGWKFETGKDGYRHILNGDLKSDMIGGIPPEFHAPPGTPPHWLPYIAAADCKATAEKAASLGAHAIMPAALIDGVGTIAVLADPQGAVFALYQPLA